MCMARAHECTVRARAAGPGPSGGVQALFFSSVAAYDGPAGLWHGLRGLDGADQLPTLIKWLISNSSVIRRRAGNFSIVFDTISNIARRYDSRYQPRP